MPPLSSASLAYVLSGFGVGVLVGMTGVGGRSLKTPLLVLLFGIHPVTAVGTDLFFAAATKTAGTLVHGLRGTVRWGIVGRLACGSVPATGLTLLGLSYFDVHGAALNQLTTLVLAGALFLAAGALIFRQPLIALYAAHVGELGSRSTGALTIGVGALLGMLVSTTVQ
ncbi:MAG: TSUP family transporter [Microvirga sp.]